MKIVVADQAGFCFGVKRALKLVERLHREGKSVQTLGPLIHNRSVLDELARKGICQINTLAEYDSSNVLVIRTHGIPRNEEILLRHERIEYVDATCPLVKKAHKIVERLGRKRTQVVIVGDRDHPEVMAARSYADKAVIVHSTAEARALPFARSISVVAQTTLDIESFQHILAILVEKTEHLQVFNTICAATRVRQEGVKKIAPAVDFMVVIGGKHSSNSRKLADIARELNPHTFHVEGSGDLRRKNFVESVRLFKTVGIAAGASTPDEEIGRVSRFLRDLHP